MISTQPHIIQKILFLELEQFRRIFSSVYQSLNLIYYTLTVGSVSNAELVRSSIKNLHS